MTTHLNEIPPFWPEIVAVDLETTTLDPFTGHILSITVSDGVDSYIFLHTFGFSHLKSLFENSEIVKIFHNAMFDMKWLKCKLDVDVQNFYDTMLVEQVIIGGRQIPASLEEVLARRLGVLADKSIRDTFKEHPGFHITPPTDAQLAYMVDDVQFLLKIREQQLVEIVKDKLVRTCQIEFDALPGFIEIELGGYCFDVDLWFEQVEQYKDLMDKHSKRMKELIGEDFVLTFPSRAKKNPHMKEIQAADINLKSPEQLLHLLNGHFKLYASNTNDSTLELLSNGNTVGAEFVRELRGFRKWKKRLEYDYPRFINPVTGKIHPSIHQLGTATGRVSFSNPNMQQVLRPDNPDEPNMRNLFMSDDPDYVLIRCDYSQQEMRVMAELSGDKALIDACNTEDVYVEIAKTMYGETIDKKDHRRHIAKTVALATAYGAGEDKIAKASGLPPKKVKEVRNLVRSTFPTMAAYANRTSNFVENYGYISTAVGSRRYFDRHSKFFTEAVNTPIQGTSAYMFKLALGYIYKWITEQKKLGNVAPLTRIYHVIHDENVVQAHIDEVEKVSEVVKQFMEQAGKELCPNVLHRAESGYGRRWDK